jgi:hypothetical protein
VGLLASSQIIRRGLVKRSFWVTLGVSTLISCGPIDYINTVHFKASRAIAEAKAAEAEKMAPYEFTSAKVYLRMAKEKAAYADFEIAIDYGTRAHDMAKDALKLAGERRRVAAEPPSARGGDSGGEP